MRGRPTAAAVVAAKSLLCSASSHPYSTFASGGGGRGRGRGSAPPPPRVPGQTQPDADDADFVSPGLGHGRGQPVLPSSPVLPSFSSWISHAPPSPASDRVRAHPPPPPLPVSTGRGRGRPPPSPEETPDSQTKKPIFLRRDDLPRPPLRTPPPSDPDSSAPPQSRFMPVLPGAGRGKPAKPVDSVARPSEENRHRLPKSPSAVPVRRGPRPPDQRTSPGGGRGERGRGGRGAFRGRGRGGRSGGRRQSDDTSEEDSWLYVDDKAGTERLERRLGEENMKKLAEGFEDLSSRVLPSPLDDAYLDALHTNNLIEYEPEYLVEFDRNPDIDEKPPMSLEEALEKAKPFLIAYEGIQSQEEWEEAVKDIMEKLPHMKELIDMYCGPNRVTAKQQQQELERVAKTLPENIPSSVKRFTDRAVLSLQSNPGWGWDKKCQFMDKLAWEVSQHYN